jgi:hypothetical protein
MILDRNLFFEYLFLTFPFFHSPSSLFVPINYLTVRIVEVTTKRQIPIFVVKIQLSEQRK